MSDVPGFHVTKALGAVYGLTVRSAGLTTVVASIAGGELESFTNMVSGSSGVPRVKTHFAPWQYSCTRPATMQCPALSMRRRAVAEMLSSPYASTRRT